MTVRLDPMRYLTGPDLDFSADEFARRMGAHYHPTPASRDGLEPIVCECIARAVYVAHLGATDLADLHRRLLVAARENADVARFFRDSARHHYLGSPVRTLETTCAQRMEQVGAELRRIAATLVTEHAEQL